MQFIPKTVLGLFDSSQKYFVIPVYQRAYSWEEYHWNAFFNDLKEQAYGHNNYFYGNLLLETIKKDKEYEIIDGQQRLTTLTIFIRSLLNVLSERIKIGEIIEIDLKQKESIYLVNNGIKKLRPVDYDRGYFDTFIIENVDHVQPATPSQKRIKNAKDFFCKELAKEETKIIIAIMEKLEDTEITCIELEGKKDSALMFELQNNRGKDLTNMEKLKSFFMYQVYVYSKQDEAENNVTYLSDLYKSIYLIVNDIRTLDEDSVLIYHCQSYINGYAYRNIDDIKSAFSKTANKIDWIKNFVVDLLSTFGNIKSYENSNSSYARDLDERLEAPVFIYPFIIRGYKHITSSSDLDKLFKILEVVVYRYRLVNSRADIKSRLNEILRSYCGDNESLKSKLNEKLNEENYWSLLRLKEGVSGFMYDNSVINYTLWKYENSIQNKGYVIKKIEIIDEEIEHIAPQTPTGGEPLESGYEIDASGQYSDDFIMKYLNCIGNLLLISKSHNCSIGNKPFCQKMASYNSNPLLNQQAEIKEFIPDDGNVWNSQIIEKRQEKIVSFCLKNWDFEKLF